MQIEYKIKNGRFGITRQVRLVINGEATRWFLNNNYVAIDLAQAARDAGHDVREFDVARLITE